ncbi:hypothetical protein M7I_2406 [Glarea lozoyensis 74030]|uniref:Uncharacterized protein n=1 Tax=Glarea lozoyensis (strain ATCC 74030 / MF5533) TaxID=1104152 RepID=H0EIP4_GLAL7|nr:hypothetical protein M7I_2406 [Glarea lozoyensis 74030]
MAPTHATLKAQLYTESTLKMVFKLGVAHSHGILPEDLFKRWIDFLVEDLALLDFGDTMLSADYQRIDVLFKDLRKWVDGPKGPSGEMVREAERAAPKKVWRAPALHATWKYEVRPGGKRGPETGDLEIDLGKGT